MARPKKPEMPVCCAPVDGMGACCVDALLNVDERGQMVLPKEVRQKMRIRPGDKLMCITWEKEDGVNIMTLIPATKFAQIANDYMGALLPRPKKGGK